MMRSKIFSLTLLSFFVVTNIAQAQQSSSLQELKNYTPPPMFGGPAPTPETVPPPAVFQPPAAPTEKPVAAPVQSPQPSQDKQSANTAPLPSPEKLLSHPVTITPTGAAAAVPIVPTQSVEATASEEFIAPPAPPPQRRTQIPPLPVKEGPKKQPVKKESEKKALDKKESKNPTAKAPNKEKNSKETTKPKETVKREDIKPAVTPKTPAPKIAAAKTRPVEQEMLPPLPKNIPSAQPSVPEKIIDQSLKNNLVDTGADDLVKKVAPVGSSVLRLPKKDEKTVDTSFTKPIPLPLTTVKFQGNMTELQTAQTAILRSNVLPRLKSDKAARLQILAYATGEANDGQSAARRTSLARGLSIRAWFLEQGIAASRMDVRALGANTRDKPTDRVDLLVIK
jgi:hypothetical protein